MRPRFSTFATLVALLCASASSATAQFFDSRPAFERAVFPFIGLASFGTRLSDSTSTAKYGGSVVIGLEGEYPLTRRFGFLGTLAVAPVSKQEVNNTGNSINGTYQSVRLVRANVGFGFRFKPTAPVFFYAGVGVLAASQYAFPLVDGSEIEPQAAFRIGYDAVKMGPWNLRMEAGGYVVAPKLPGNAPASLGGTLKKKATAFDWDFRIGGRYDIDWSPKPR